MNKGGFFCSFLETIFVFKLVFFSCRAFVCVYARKFGGTLVKEDCIGDSFVTLPI